MKPAPVTSECPDAKTLTTYVSGSLDETQAEALSRHVERCPHCQQVVDSMVVDADSLIDAVRRRVAGQVHAEQPDLAELIAGAQQLSPTEAVPAATPKTGADDSRVISLEVFMTCLHKSRLINQSEVELLAEQISPADCKSFARELISRKKLTPFQAKALVQGKWKGLVLGNYVVLEKLGQGGMGHVFKARHRRMGRIVCLKVLQAAAGDSPELIERFRREARTVAALDHPNIVVAHDADEADGMHFLVMEFIQGSDLSKVVDECGPMSLEAAVPLVLQVARALEYAHGQGVIHRDIKPHNLLLDEAESVKILDMGLARFDSYLGHHPDASTHASMTTSGVIMGTVDYMSPEQALNSRHADARSDVYSLGGTLHFLLTGQPLYDGETVMEKLIAHRERPVPKLSDDVENVPPGLDAIFQKMVAKEPCDRYASMAELAQDLQTYLDGGRPLALELLKPVPAKRFGMSQQTLIRAAAAVAAVLVIGLGIGLGLSLTGMWDEALPPVATSAAVSTPPSPPPPPPMIGHANTLANGGPGRVLVVIPHKDFYPEELELLIKSLADRKVEYVIASSATGAATPKLIKHRKDDHPVDVKMLLQDFHVDDFDGVIFSPGDVREFTHKGTAGESVKNMINACLDSSRVVASVGNGQDVINDSECVAHCQFQRNGEVEVANPDKRQGAIAKIHQGKYTAKLVQVMFDEILGKQPSTTN